MEQNKPDYQELWDKYSEYIDDDIDSLSFWAGTTVLSMRKFQELIAKLPAQPSGMRWVTGEYDKLYAQVKGGKRTVCYIDGKYGDGSTYRDICTIKPTDPEMWLSSRGMGYGCLLDYKGETLLDQFIAMCIDRKVEWLCEDGEQGELPGTA